MKTTLKILIISFIFFAAISSAKASILSTPGNNLGLVAYYPFEDGSGSIATDHSGNDNKGTLTNMESSDWIEGIRNGAVVLDGTNDEYIDIPNGSFPKGTGTISQWVKINDYDQRQIIGPYMSDCNSSNCNGFGSSGANLEVELGYVEDDRLRFMYQDGAPSTAQATVTFPDISETFGSGWGHVAVTYNTSGDLKLYVNGTFSTSTDMSVKSFNGISPNYTYIGRPGQAGTGRHLDGEIDEVRIYNRALSATEISNLYNLGGRTINAKNNSSLVAYYPFEDSSGSKATDHSGNGNIGTLTNMENADWVDGKSGKALDFDGSDEYIDTGSSNLGIATDDTATISAWIYPRGQTSAPGYIVNDYNRTNALGWIFSLGTDNKVTITNLDNSGGDRRTSETSALSLNQWHHVVAILYPTDTELFLYVDGVLDSTETFDLGTITQLYQGSGNVMIGRESVYATPQRYFNGKIDEVRIYNRALSATEVAQLYGVGRKTINAINNSGLVAYWAFEDASGSKVTDHSGNGNTGTLTNMEAADWVDGIRGGALNFDGSVSEDVVITTFGPNYTASDSFTYALWAKADVVSAENLYFMLGSIEESGNDALIQMAFDGGVVCDSGEVLINFRDTDTSATDAICSTNTWDDEQWHHFAFVFDVDNTLITLYIDGADDGNTAITGNSDGNKPFASYPFYLGARNNRGTTANFFDGQLDEVRIYNRALSATEVLNLYNTKR